MYCVRTSSTAEEIIKKSRFVSYLIPCASLSDLNKALTGLAAEHPNASHIAFAYRIKTEAGIVARFNDAQEPSGTAGKPIFQHLEARNLVNCLLAVVRYFGGIKLGAGGLTRAYGHAAGLAIDANGLVEFVEYHEVSVVIDYAQLRRLEYQLGIWEGTIESAEYGERIELRVKIPQARLVDLKQWIERNRE